MDSAFEEGNSWFRGDLYSDRVEVESANQGPLREVQMAKTIAAIAQKWGKREKQEKNKNVEQVGGA